MASTKMNDSRSPRRTDLLSRRRRLGATRRAVAANIGLLINQVTEIEEGTASARFATRTPSGSTDSRRGRQTSARRSCSLQKKVSSVSDRDQFPESTVYGLSARISLRIEWRDIPGIGHGPSPPP